jgi:uncharacterized membrane protein HdeD (DUF308 family)
MASSKLQREGLSDRVFGAVAGAVRGPEVASGLVSIALGVVLFIRPDIGAASLATVFGLFSVVYGVSAVVLSFQARNTASTARRPMKLHQLTEFRMRRPAPHGPVS